MDDIAPVLFMLTILAGIIYAGALAVDRPKLWWLGGILFVLGFAITMSANGLERQGQQIGGAVLGLPFVIGFFARKIFAHSSVFARFVGSVLSSLSVGALLSLFGLSAGTISINSLVTGLAVMFISSIFST